MPQATSLPQAADVIRQAAADLAAGQPAQGRSSRRYAPWACRLEGSTEGNRRGPAGELPWPTTGLEAVAPG